MNSSVFDDVWRADLVSKINALLITPDVKAVLLEIVKSIRPGGVTEQSQFSSVRR
jgi:hypothetical protein